LKKGSKKKSRFSVMIEQDTEKCPEGQKWWSVKQKCIPVGSGDGEKKRMRKGGDE
jgi:hypothetical protein